MHDVRRMLAAACASAVLAVCGCGTAPTNLPPTLTLTGIMWESPGSFELYGIVSDPEEGDLPCRGRLSAGSTLDCAYVSATATGDCRPDVLVKCSCLAGVEVTAYKTESSGTCTLRFVLKDSSGTTSHTSATVTYPR